MTKSADRAFEAVLDEIEARVTPAEERYEPRPPRDVLRDNFRTSFKLSNGSARLQFLYYVRLTDMLRVTHDAEIVATTAHEMTYDTPDIAVPFRHAAQSETSYEIRGKKIWAACMDVVVNRDNLDAIAPTKELGTQEIEDLHACANKGEILFSIPEHLMLRDMYYLSTSEGRPNRTDDASRFRSMTRDYAILGKPTGSPEFDFAMQEAGSVIKAVMNPDRTIPRSLTTFNETIAVTRQLSTAWQLRHTEPFFPFGTFDYEVAS